MGTHLTGDLLKREFHSGKSGRNESLQSNKLQRWGCYEPRATHRLPRVSRATSSIMGIELRLLINKGQFKATDKPLQHFGQNHFSYLVWEKTGVNNQIRLGRNQNNFPYQLHFSVNMTSTDESVNKKWYILTLECYLAIKRNEILIHTTWINP